jgi:hypothetical protein
MPVKTNWHEPLVTCLIAAHGGQRPEEIIERYADSLRKAAHQASLQILLGVIASVGGIKRG